MAGGRQSKRAFGADEQLEAEFLLHILELHADGRWRKMDLAGGGSDSAMPMHREKGA
jgi:hypothetical protein